MNKYIPILKKLFVLGIVVLAGFNAKATHIVGGEMNYTCLGNNNYEIELTIYRDCFYADPRAFFDDPAYIGVFNMSNQLVGNLNLPLLNNDTIPAILNDSCLFVPADVCVHTTTYRGVINLPVITGGYQLAYERCCRNETILNIVDPLNAGAVYNTFISEEAMLGCNNSAKFTEWPPLFVCVNEPIDWDHSANDVDGDSLVYSLCTPLSGGSQAIPKPVPTNNPPYDNVIWNDPAYDLDNLLGGTPLTINSATGRLTAIPGVIGQFVVGICVEEYRNGVLISQTRRDFQYNVGECGMVESTIVAPEVQCENLSVTFKNESLNADSFEWNFNDPNNPNATSTEVEPTYTYSEPGTYTIELISATRTVCRDTSYHTIFLQQNSMEADFVVDIQDCVEQSTLVVTDQSTDPISAPNQWSWSLSVNGSITQTADVQNPIFTVAAPASVELSLTTTSENGCVDGSSKTFATAINDPGDQIASNIIVCKDNASELNPGFGTGYTYQWASNALFDDLTNPNPTINISESVQLEVTITTDDGACSSTKVVDVEVRELPAVNNIPDEFVICAGESVQFNSQDYPNIDFVWQGENLDNPTGDTPTATPTTSGVYTVNFTEVSGSCTASKSINVIVNETPDEQLAAIPDQTTICSGTSAGLNLNGDNNFTYNWTGEGLEGVTIQNPTVGPNASTSYQVIVTNPVTGCSGEKSVAVFVPADIDLSVAGDRSLCFNQETTLQGQGVGNLSFEWTSADGSIMSNAAMLVFQDVASKDIQLMATNDEGCTASILVNVDVADRIDALDNLPDSVLVCENIPTSLSSNENNQLNYLWTPSANLDDATTSIPVFTSDETTIYTVEATNPLNGCKTEKSLRAVVPQKIDLQVSDDIATCGDDPINLQASSATGQSYSWIQENGANVGTTPIVSVDPKVNANYIVEVVDEFGCFVTDSVRVTFQGISANIGVDMLETCDDEVQILLSDVNAVNNNTYSWGPAESIIMGENSASPIVLNNTNDPIAFQVTITNDKGCSVMDEVEVSNRFNLQALDTGVDACLDVDIDLNPNADPSYTYLWGPANLLSDATAANPSFTPTSDQLFTVTVSDNDGCSTIREVQVTTVDLDAIVDIDIEADTILSGEQTQLEVTFDPDFTYLWIPPTSLSDNTVNNPIANPTETTNYSVMITDSRGCVATETITLTVLSSECDEPFVFFPNAFTPNGDGINDVLRIRGNAVSEVSFVIYNRWGERMFEADSVDDEWDGTFEGKQLPPDVYGYYLEAKCVFGGEFKKQGNVTILE